MKTTDPLTNLRAAMRKVLDADDSQLESALMNMGISESTARMVGKSSTIRAARSLRGQSPRRKGGRQHRTVQVRGK